ncbi:ras association domain-containing protein 7 isoform X3 [Cebus imitator]|uniref:ras association domain-containing protein 7 isoform X3 n=1 Tax=Cebus imitator TaxID=2715852 RepID=UPI00080A3FA1|nr:ras association domain-containing protein 7 isoform X3 [Cebus imitator]
MLLGLAAMELKVWVDGVQRVVCGVSEQTTCQEVVIALAQAIGQTGRFVLVQRLREKERQLLPEECPVGAQATCGQFASDVQFVLRRTGPSLAGRPSSDSCSPPERCPIRASLPAKPRALDAQARALEAELQLAAEAPGPPSPMASATERLRQDLAVQERQSAEVQGSLALVSRALEAAERALQAQAQELEELNRELRQCNLQQFIQQTGAALPPPPRPDRDPPNTQGPLSPARQESLLGPPLSPVLVPALGPEGMSVSCLPLGPGALLWPQPPQPVSFHSGCREAELEVAAAPAPERRPLAAQPQAL